MSVANILGADGKIKAIYLPGGSGNAYVDNPMAENLDGGGFDMLNIDDITCSNIRAKSHDVLDNTGAVVVGSFITGAPISGSTPVVLNTGLTVQGDANIGLIVDGAYGISALTASLETLDITTATPGAGINFTSGGGISGVAGITGTGTLSMDAVSAVNTVDAPAIETGLLSITVGTNSFIGDKSLIGGSGTVVAPAIAANDIIFITPQCQFVGGVQSYYTATINVGVGFTIESKKLSDGTLNAADTSTVGFVVIRAA